jgi:hypothetical protein
MTQIFGDGGSILLRESRVQNYNKPQITPTKEELSQTKN